MVALKELKNNSAINLKKADKGTTTVIMNKSNKIQEAEVQLENREHYKPLEAPGGVLLGILGGGVPLGSSNPDPISDLNMPFSTPVFRPDL